YAAFWKDREISVGQIRSLTPTNTGVQMMLQDEKAPSVFMMRKKDQVVLFDHFEKNGPKSESIPYPYTKKRKS
ncbi:TPA: ebsA protein, partial [Enterococcus faecium]